MLIAYVRNPKPRDGIRFQAKLFRDSADYAFEYSVDDSNLTIEIYLDAQQWRLIQQDTKIWPIVQSLVERQMLEWVPIPYLPSQVFPTAVGARAIRLVKQTSGITPELAQEQIGNIKQQLDEGGHPFEILDQLVN